jgi:magnesium-protoporphyrin IX monomethyl ester (oxidative) cyclase
VGKNVSLIAPPFLSQGKLSYLPNNLGIGYLAAFLEAHGHSVQIIDGVVRGSDISQTIWSYGRQLVQTGLLPKQIAEAIDPDVDLIGIGSPFTMHAMVAKQVAGAIKARFPNTPLVLGGVYPSTLPNHALDSAADFAIRGEAEIALLKFVETNDAAIPGVYSKGPDCIVGEGTGELVQNLDEIPFPARHKLNMDKRLNLSQRGQVEGKTASMITSRGCPFDCSFCSIHHVVSRKWRARSSQNVLEEISSLIHEYGVEQIEFEDDNLTLNKNRALEMFSGMAKLKKDHNHQLRWSCSNGLRVDTLDRELLVQIKESGCTALSFAVESGSPEVLKRMNKKLDDLGKVEEVARACAELDIETHAFMIVGHPGETDERFRESLAFFKKLTRIGVKCVIIHMIKAYPGTRLFDECKAAGYLVNTELTHTRNIEGGTFLDRNYVNIVTPDFSEKDVLWRKDHAQQVLNPVLYYRLRFPLLQSVGNTARRGLPDGIRRLIRRSIQAVG